MTHEQPRQPQEDPGRHLTLPAIWNVPHPRNPNFTGREELLAQLEAGLRSGGVAILTELALVHTGRSIRHPLHSLGGVGKTQLAAEYVYRHAADYDLVWWLQAEESASLAGQFWSLAATLYLPEGGATDQMVAVDAVRRWLRRHGRWLLVFDGAGQSREIREYLPETGEGHVVITSRASFWAGVAETLPVPPLPEAEAVELLLKRSGRADRDGTKELVGELGRHPLALEQAAAYTEATGVTFDDYHLRLHRTSGVLHGTNFHPSPAMPTDYQRLVARTTQLAFERLQQTSPVGADLLRLCAFLAPENIPLDVICWEAAYLPGELGEAVAREAAFDDAVGQLRRYALVEVGNRTLSVHRLVQLATREALEERDAEIWAGVAVALMNAAVPTGGHDSSTWPDAVRLLPHAMAAANYADFLDVAVEPTGQLMNRLGVYVAVRGQLVPARALLERAVALFEATSRDDHPEVVSSLDELRIVSRVPAALEESGEWALAVSKIPFDFDGPHMATTLGNLGVTLLALGDPEGARDRLESAMLTLASVYGSDSPEVAQMLANLGHVLLALGDPEGAQQLFERARRIRGASD